MQHQISTSISIAQHSMDLTPVLPPLAPGSVLGYVHGFVLGSVLGFIHGFVLGSVLGYVLGFVPCSLLGFVLA